MRKPKRAPQHQEPVDGFWDSRNVKTAKTLRQKIQELQRRAGCRTFSDYVRQMVRMEISRANL